MGYIIFFILFLSRFAVAAATEYKITPIPAQRFQGNIGACGSFAVATVLDHLLCQKNPELCKTPVINTLDIMRTSAEDYDGVTYPSDIIKNLSEKSIYVETCRPYESFKGPLYSSDKYTVTVNSTGEKRSLKENEYDILAKDHLSEIYNKKIKWRSDIIWRSKAFRELKSDLDKAVSFDISWSQVTKAIDVGSEEEFISTLIFPEPCSRVQLPKLSFNYLPVATEKTSKEVSEKIKELIVKNTPVIWTYFPNHQRSKMAHTAVILGYRKGEYLVTDSASVVQKAPGQFWISQDYVMQKSIEYDRVGGYCKNPDKSLCSISLTYVN